MADYHSLSIPERIVKEWYERGTNEKEALFKFVSYWIVFNQLYNYGIENLDDYSETRRIQFFCRDHIDVLADIIDFDTPYLDEMKSSPVIDGTAIVDLENKDGDEKAIAIELFKKMSNRRSDRDSVKKRCSWIASDYIRIRDNSTREDTRIISLFMTMYRVRCNLFHGMKRPNAERDYNLVRDSATILEECLPALMVDTFGRSTW